MGGWPDHHRPKDLKAMALTPELRQRFAWYLAGEVLPHSLFLHGPPGFGKTTVATIIADTLYASDGWPRVRRVKATETGTVDAIRTNVIDSMRALPGPRLVIFEEADGLSRGAQQALRVPMEDYADHCRVIFITNESTFDQALRSRCDVIEMRQPPLDECVRVLRAVLKAEGYPNPAADVVAFVTRHFANDDKHDLRTLLLAAEISVGTSASRRTRIS
jgi:DNA polymerase III delta prime subunit